MEQAPDADLRVREPCRGSATPARRRAWRADRVVVEEKLVRAAGVVDEERVDDAHAHEAEPAFRARRVEIDAAVGDAPPASSRGSRASAASSAGWARSPPMVMGSNRAASACGLQLPGSAIIAFRWCMASGMSCQRESIERKCKENAQSNRRDGPTARAAVHLPLRARGEPDGDGWPLARAIRALSGHVARAGGHRATSRLSARNSRSRPRRIRFR